MLALALTLVLAQDQSKIDAAIAKGVAWLRDKGGPPHEGGAPDHSNEMIQAGNRELIRYLKAFIGH